MRFLDKMRRTGQPPGADVSMLKIRGTEVQQMITELMMQAVGPMAQPFKAVDAGRSTTSRRAWRRATSTTARPASTPGRTRSSATSSPR
jgi:hypothetical protein